MSTKSILVTGAAGFIGSHLAEQCLQLGHQVTGIDAFTDYYPEGLKRQNVSRIADYPDFTLIEDDLLDLDLLPILHDVDVVFHLAAQPGVRASWEDFGRYTELNVGVTQRLLHAARGCGVERFVIASSSSIYGDAESFPTCEESMPRPVSPYGVTKVAVEHLAQVYWRSFEVPTVCLRYFTVYGPRQRPDMAFHRLIAGALAGEEFQVFGDGRQTRDFTFVGDAVGGTLAAAQHGAPGAVYNIGGGSRRSMDSILDTLGSLMRTPIKLRHVDRQKGDARHTAADIERARRDLGYEPTVDFETGLQLQLEWQRSSAALLCAE
jgi:UDP-glucose 4-epimerase